MPELYYTNPIRLPESWSFDELLDNSLKYLRCELVETPYDGHFTEERKQIVDDLITITKAGFLITDGQGEDYQNKSFIKGFLPKRYETDFLLFLQNQPVHYGIGTLDINAQYPGHSEYFYKTALADTVFVTIADKDYGTGRCEKVLVDFFATR